LTSVWETVYVWIVRRRVKRGTVGEMKREVKETGVERGTELEGGNPAIVDGGPKAGLSIAVIVDSGSNASRPRPSLSSIATGGETADPPKDVREFV